MSLKPPKLTNDCFALPRGVTWIPVDEALDRLKKSLHRITEIEKIPTNVAAGRILAISPTATRSSPPMSNSAVDGFGFAHSCIKSGPQVLPLTIGIAAADSDIGTHRDPELPESWAVSPAHGAAPRVHAVPSSHSGAPGEEHERAALNYGQVSNVQGLARALPQWHREYEDVP